jgi:hypothetical protein
LACDADFTSTLFFGTPGGTLKLIKMPEIQAVLDVILNELSSEHQLILKEAVEQFQQKCLFFFSKIGVVCHSLGQTCQEF